MMKELMESLKKHLLKQFNFSGVVGGVRVRGNYSCHLFCCVDYLPTPRQVGIEDTSIRI